MASLAELARRLKPLGAPRGGGAALPRLILMTDAARLADPEAAVARLPRGAAVVLRHPDDGMRHRLATRLAGLCRARGVRLLIAGDPRLAARMSAGNGDGGLHLPEAMLRHGGRRWRLLRRPGWLVTAAAHSPAAIRAAARAGADAALLSPVFATASHPDARPLGPLRFATLVRQSPLPVYALGGVSAATAARLTLSGAAGFAAIGGLAPPPPHHSAPDSSSAGEKL